MNKFVTYFIKYSFLFLMSNITTSSCSAVIFVLELDQSFTKNKCVTGEESLCDNCFNTDFILMDYIHPQAVRLWHSYK